MIKFISLFLVLILLLGVRIAAAEENMILGEQFQDFTVTDTDGNTFTLSDALKDHEAAVINLWATWCPPCRLEFPFLNEAYEQYGDRVAFISLTIEKEDTQEAIEAFRREHGIDLPMSWDADYKMYGYMQAVGIPATVVVDRFGNAVFFHNICFKSFREVASVIETFLGEEYTETVVLDEIPVPDATAAFPVAAAREVYVENENVREIAFRSEGYPSRLAAYVVDDDVAHLRMELPASDDPYDMVLYHSTAEYLYEMPMLLDAERNCYTFDVEMPKPEDRYHFVNVCLYEFLETDTSDAVDVYLIPGEEYLDELCDVLQLDWCVLSDEQAEAPKKQDALQAYILHAVDQYGEPVPGVYVNFCTDTACIPVPADGDGTITFMGAPDVYHVQLLKVPAGYSFDASFELYTTRMHGEWVLRIRKD
ncbi:MAG: TlpA family protein disulfide reductase [Clostridia bacterium]|nr:TlpA family protein disulfide reductase [Clostridia bacterium]